MLKVFGESLQLNIGIRSERRVENYVLKLHRSFDKKDIVSFKFTSIPVLNLDFLIGDKTLKQSKR